MAATPVTAPPFIPVKPKIAIGPVGSEVDIACAAEELNVEVEQDSVDTETFCGVTTSYKAEKWTITASVFPSYGTAGLWNLLRPLCNTTQPFTILPDGSAVAGPANPSMTGTARVKGFPFYSGKMGEPQAFDVELGVIGAPVFALALAAMEAAQADAQKAADEANAVATGNGGTTAPNGGGTAPPAEPAA